MSMMTSKMWDYFLQCESDDGIKRAKCTFCERLLSYSSTTYNLKSHLMRLHPEKIRFENIDTLKLRRSVLKPVKNSERRKLSFKRKNVSVVWSFFTKSDPNERVATCNLCNKPFSYKSSNTNLRTHLKRSHPDEFNIDDSSDLDNENDFKYNENGDDDAVQSYIDDESYNSTGEPSAWSFFEKETGGRARCVVCRASLPHRIKNLKQHLKDNHPKLAQSFEEASDSDDPNDTYEEVVYLEEETSKLKKPKNARRSYSHTQLVKPAKISKLSSSFDNERHDDCDDQIMKFSNYVASLLKEVPKDACMKLQMEIINLIMMTKFKLPTERENNVIIDGVPLSIQPLSNEPGAGFIVTVPSVGGSAAQSATLEQTGDDKPITYEDHRDPSECRDLPKL